MFHKRFRQRPSYQFAIGIILVVFVSTICYSLGLYLDHKMVALILLVSVSLLAILFEILPVLCAAVFSALILNYFFIPPVYTLHIYTSEDVLLLAIFLVVALVNAVLTFKIRKAEKKSREKEEKEKSIKLYNTLFNSLSHELKTPIATIIGAVDTLNEFHDSLSQNNRVELILEIGKAGERLNKQVENLLNMSRLESGLFKLNKDWCDILELVHSILRKLETESKNHQINLRCSENLPLYKLDSGLIEQVIQNLVYNAILYTPENTQIQVEIIDEDDDLVIVISDNGPGFPADETLQIFEKFYRLSHEKSGGTGLGLSIAKGFTEAHEGKIKLENIATGGAQFTIVIPCEKSYINHLKNE